LHLADVAFSNLFIFFLLQLGLNKNNNKKPCFIESIFGKAFDLAVFFKGIGKISAFCLQSCGARAARSYVLYTELQYNALPAQISVLPAPDLNRMLNKLR
jgi:hypothetical protein